MTSSLRQTGFELRDVQVEVPKGPRRQAGAGQVEIWEEISSWKVKGIRGEGDGGWSPEQAQRSGRGLQGVGGEQEERPLDLRIQKAVALGQARGRAGAVACMGVWFLTRHSLFFTEFSSFNPTAAGLGATNLSQVRPRSGPQVLCDPKAFGMMARCCPLSRHTGVVTRLCHARGLLSPSPSGAHC